MIVEKPKIEVKETTLKKEVEEIKEEKPEWKETVKEEVFENAWKGWIREERVKKIKKLEEEGDEVVIDQTGEVSAKEDQVTEDLAIETPDMSRDGTMKCLFSQPLQVPSFLQKTEGTGRLLVAMQEIDLTRDLMDVRFFLKSDVDTEDIKYNLGVQNWTENSFDISINFTDPQ